MAVDKHYYSAPYQLIHQTLDVRLTQQTVELFRHGQRVAATSRSHQPGRFTTLENTVPSPIKSTWSGLPAGSCLGQNHRPGVRPTRRKNHAKPAHPEQGFRSALGIRLEKLSAKAAWKPLSAGPLVRLLLWQASNHSQKNLDAQPLEPELPFSAAHAKPPRRSYYA